MRWLTQFSLALLATFTTVYAAENNRIEYPVGEDMVAYPILRLSVGYDSGVWNSDGADYGSPAVGLMLGGGVQGINRGHLYGIEYVADGINYTGGDSVDNVLDQRLVGYWGHAFNDRNNFDIGIEYIDAHDRRGEEDPTLNRFHTSDRDEPDKWKQTQVGGTYTYGADGARGKIDFSTCYACKRYTNNDQEYRDLNTLDFGVRLSARVAQKTYGFVEFINTNFDYINQQPGDYTDQLDSTERRYLVGATWDATRKTSGTVRVGMVEKKFEDNNFRDDYNNFLYDVAIDWRPNNNNFVNTSFGSRPYEAVEYDEFIYDDFVDVQQLDVTWGKRWTPRVVSSVSFYRGWDEYHPTGRQDDRYGMELGLRYKLKKGSIGIRAWSQKRDAGIPGHDWSDNAVALDFNIGEIFGFGGARSPNICRTRTAYSSYRY